MSVWSLALAYLRERALASALNAVLLALGVASVSALLLLTHQAQNRLERDTAGVDLVVGPKGSPLQLILSSLFHLDAPIGNIPVETVAALEANPLVARAIPLALGDSYQGARVVGAGPVYYALFGAEVAEGRLPDGPLQAVVGASAARTTGLSVGDRFFAGHGLQLGGPAHRNAAYDVVGILAPSGGALDRIIVTPVESVWLAHGIHVHAPHPGEDPDADDHGPVPGQDVTAILVQYATPLAAVRLPAQINESARLMAAVPARESQRLFALMGAGLDVMGAFAWVLVGASALGVFVTLASAMRERRKDVALMRVMGASRGRVLAQVLCEGMIVAAAGVALGLVLGHGLVALFAELHPRAGALGLTGWAWAPGQGIAVLAAFGLGAAGAVLPALAAYRVDIVRTLAP